MTLLRNVYFSFNRNIPYLGGGVVEGDGLQDGGSVVRYQDLSGRPI